MPTQTRKHAGRGRYFESQLRRPRSVLNLHCRGRTPSIAAPIDDQEEPTRLFNLMPAYHEMRRTTMDAQLASASPAVMLAAKLASLERRKADMLRANELILKADRQALTLIGYSDEGIENLLTPDAAGRTGYTSQQIEALDSEIERLQNRLKQTDALVSTQKSRPPSKWLVVRSAPTAATLWNAVTPAYREIETLAEALLLRAWKYALAARYMMERSIEPRSYDHRRQHHMLHQCGSPDIVAKIEHEVRRRGLLAVYGVEICFSAREPVIA